MFSESCLQEAERSQYSIMILLCHEPEFDIFKRNANTKVAGVKPRMRKNKDKSNTHFFAELEKLGLFMF